MTGDPVLRVLLAAAFLLVALRLLYLNRQEEKMARESMHWPSTTTGHVIASRLNYHPQGRGPNYGLDIVYEYSVRGTTYQSDRLEFGIGRYLDRSDAQDIVEGHPPGSRVRVYYCPTNPQWSTLRPGRPEVPFIVGYAFIFMLLAAASFCILNALGSVN